MPESGMGCPNCRAPNDARALECAACGIIFAKWAEREARAKAAPAASEPAVAKDAESPLSRNGLIALPAAVFGFSALAAWLAPTRFWVHAALSMQVHELGHALAAWLGGLFALPIPLLTLTFGENRSILVILAFATVLLGFFMAAWSEGCLAAAALAGALLLLQAALTLFASQDALRFWVSFGGLGGECLAAAALAAMYFHPLPKLLQWPRVRVFFLCVGSLVLAQSLRTWLDASADFEKVPWGSVFGGDGDVEAMITGGWTVNRLTAVYLRLSWICVLFVLGNWAWSVWRSKREVA